MTDQVNLDSELNIRNENHKQSDHGAIGHQDMNRIKSASDTDQLGQRSKALKNEFQIVIKRSSIHPEQFVDQEGRAEKSLATQSEVEQTSYIGTKMTQCDSPLTVDDDEKEKRLAKTMNQSSMPLEVSSVDEALEHLGSFGKYQKQIWALLTLIWCGGNLCIYPMGFYQLQPQYECRHFDSATQAITSWKHCTNDEACGRQQTEIEQDDQSHPFKVLEYRIDYTQEKSLVNWVQKFNMQCSPKKEFGYFGSMYFLGSIFGSMVVPRSADIFGRKLFTIGCTIIHFLACLVVLLTSNLTIAQVAMSAQGFTMLGRALIGIVWLSESMQLKYTTRSTGILFFLDAFNILYASIYFKYVSKQWTYFYAVPAAMIFLAAIILCIFFQDSPKFHYGRKQYDEARRCLTAIGRRNGVLGPNETFDARFTIEKLGDSENEDEKASVNVRDFLKNKTNLCNSLIMIVLFLASPFCYYMLAFNIKYFPGDIFTNQIVNSIAEAIGQGPLLFLMQHFLTIKTTFLISFGSNVLSFGLIILCAQYNWISIIPWAVLLTKASVAVPNALVFIALTQYFEPQFVGLILSVVNILGRINNAATPMVAEMPEPIPLLVCVFYCIIAFLSVIMLKNANQTKIDASQKQSGLENESQINEYDKQKQKIKQNVDIELEKNNMETVNKIVQ